MGAGEILHVLEKEFGLELNEKTIIKSLLDRAPLTADEICVKTEIPKGRVYDYLNELVANELILKTAKQPTEYYIDSLERRLVEYSYRRLLRVIESQARLLRKTDAEVIIPITSVSQFALVRSRERMMADRLDHIIRDQAYPSFFYPHGTEEEYLDFREKFIGKKIPAERKAEILLSLRSFQKFMSKKAPARYVMSADSLERYVDEVTKKFGEKKSAKILTGIKDFVEKNRLQFHVVNEPCAYSMIVFDNSLTFVILEPPSGELFVNGFLLRGKKNIERYRSIFEERFVRGVPIQKIIIKKLSGLK